jgi:hypothetical protein
MTYETKDSGKRATFTTGMQRDTAEGKIRYDLIVPLSGEGNMMRRWAELMTRGAQKYEARNWEKAATDTELERYKESAFRHFMQWYFNETDEDHGAAVFFNIQGFEYVKERLAKKYNK